MKQEETHPGIGLSFAIGVMLIVGGIFTLPFGIVGIIIGFFLVSGASKKVDKLNKK